MDTIKIIVLLFSGAILAGCASMDGAQGPRGPKLVGSGQATEYGQYAEIGVEFSSVGDFVAFVSPKRWKSPIATGGSLSWVNPIAWSEDAGRTGRIFLGEAVIVGGVVAAATAGGGGSSSDSISQPDIAVEGPTGPNPGSPPPAPF